MSSRSATLLIDDMLEAVAKIESYTHTMSEVQFKADNKTADAVVYNLEIIGEAANRMPEDDRRKYPAVEWNKIIGLRHRIVHDYFGIDLDIIWNIVKNDLSSLKNILSKK